MNPIVKAINDIKMTIPKEILDLAYNSDYTSMETIESKIEQVIRSRVLVDTNLVGGVTMYVPMSIVSIIDTDDYGGVVIEIPSEAVDNRKIISVHSLVTSSSDRTSIVSTDDVYQSCEKKYGAISNESMKIMKNLDSLNIEVTSNLELIGERTVYIRDKITDLRGTIMKLVVENQSYLQNLPPRAYINFSILCSYAVKADIYNKLIVKLDQGYIHTGHQMGVVTDIVNKYEDMNEQYLEYLNETWASVVFMSDNTEMNSYVGSLFGNNM